MPPPPAIHFATEKAARDLPLSAGWEQLKLYLLQLHFPETDIDHDRVDLLGRLQRYRFEYIERGNSAVCPDRLPTPPEERSPPGKNAILAPRSEESLTKLPLDNLIVILSDQLPHGCGGITAARDDLIDDNRINKAKVKQYGLPEKDGRVRFKWHWNNEPESVCHENTFTVVPPFSKLKTDIVLGREFSKDEKDLKLQKESVEMKTYEEADNINGCSGLLATLEDAEMFGLAFRAAAAGTNDWGKQFGAAYKEVRTPNIKDS